MSTPLKVFCCSAREDQEMLEQLKKHLISLQRNDQITIWSDTDLNAGVEWEKELHHHLESADIILLLISPDFMASDYCYSTEMRRAIERHNEGSVVVIPILLRSIHWEDAPFARLQVVPTKTRPVANWSDRDDAFRDITRHLNRVIIRLQTKQNTSSFSPETDQKAGESHMSFSVPLENDHSGRTTPTGTIMLVRDEESHVSHLPELTLAELFRQLAADQGDQTMREVYERLDLLTTANMEHVLGTLLDPMAFPDPQEFAQGLKQAYLRVQKDNVTSAKSLVLLLGAIGLVCFTLQLLNLARRQNYNGSFADLDWPQTLLKEPAVRHWFKEVYAPPQSLFSHSHTQEHEDAKRMLARRHWQDLDFDSLELYRVGTTSFILRCQIPLLVGEPLVLKCLLFPYTRIPAITDATRNYFLPPQEKDVSATVRILSSTSKWILMDFINGLNLREFLQKRRRTENQQPPYLRTDLLTSIGKPLLAALTRLSQTGLRHEDLTPSNIMVREKSDGSIDQIMLIDIGRNYLYTRHVGIEASREALFVAPEIKAGQKAEATSDLYSFGMILIELADPAGAQEGALPESLYQYAPHLARLIEDLIDANPKHRRLIFPIRNENEPYTDLCALFEDLLRILPPEHEMKPRRFSWAQQFLALFYPGRQLRHARELWHMTHSSLMRPRYAGWLFGWFLMNVFITWAIFGISLVPSSLTIHQTLVHGCGGMCLPLFSVYASEGLLMRGIGLSCGLIQSAYYTNILAGLTTRSIKGKFAGATEFFLRAQTIVNLLLISIGIVIQPGWWLALYILMGPTPAMINTLCYHLAARVHREAQGALSTVPLVEDLSLKNFGHWGTTFFAYIIMVSLVWAGLHFGILSDTWAYASIIVMINVFTLCISKSIRQATDVRGSLSRAFTIGERLEALKKAWSESI